MEGEDDLENFQLDMGGLDMTTTEVSFEDADGHIQANLEDEYVKEALSKGLDLREFSQQIEEELQEVERDSVQDYLQESKNMAQLHVQIQDTDIILERMEDMLGLFQADLGNISGEIQSLQDQSLSMNVKLKNRKAVQTNLADFVGGMSISDTLVGTICNGQVNDEYIKALEQLDKKLNYVANQSENTASTSQVSDDLESLTIKASAKIKDFVLQKIYAVRKPMSSLELQQNTLLKFKDVFKFLAKHSKPAAVELKREYLDTFSKVHYTYFKTYLQRLLKLQHEETADKDDLMGALDSQPRQSFFSTKTAMKSRTTVFTIGNRGAVLQELEAPILVPHTKKGEDTRYPYERLFRSLQFALRDASAREFLFCVEFFRIKEAAAIKFFGQVMGKTLHHLLKHEETHIESWFDSLSVVLCCRIITTYQNGLLAQNIPCLTPFYEQLLAYFWPRFKAIVSLNGNSIQAVDIARLPQADSRPHFIVRRYAEYSGALLELNDGPAFVGIVDGLTVLRQEVANFILRMAAEFPLRREQLIFLINNYDMMMGVYTARAVEGTGNAKSEEMEEFEQLLQMRIREFAEEELSGSFGGIMSFVKDTEQTLARTSNPASIRVDQNRIQTLIRSFSKDWKGAISNIEGNIMKTFTNFKNGTAILQTSLTQLVIIYERFLAILKNPPFKKAGGWSDLVDNHVVRVEVKKHKSMFS